MTSFEVRREVSRDYIQTVQKDDKRRNISNSISKTLAEHDMEAEGGSRSVEK